MVTNVVVLRATIAPFSYTRKLAAGEPVRDCVQVNEIDETPLVAITLRGAATVHTPALAGPTGVPSPTMTASAVATYLTPARILASPAVDEESSHPT